MFTEIQHQMYDFLIDKESEAGYVIIDRDELLLLLEEFNTDNISKEEVIREYLAGVEEYIN